MVIRIRWRSVSGSVPTLSYIALATGALLAPLSVLAFTISIWAFTKETQSGNAYPSSRSAFARWQVWLAIAAVLLAFGQILGRLAPTEDGMNAETKSRFS
jgi:hypothetical protein